MTVGVTNFADAYFVGFGNAFDDLVVVPRTDIINKPCRIFTTKEVSQLILINDLKQFLFITTSYDLDLLACFLVEPCLDNRVDSCEEHWGVDYH